MREEKDLAALAHWRDTLMKTTNKAFYDLFADEHRYLVLMGGGGSGKSVFAGRKILERVTGEPGHRWLVCRKVAKTLRESCFRQLCGQIAEHYADQLARCHKSDLRITFINGSEIVFAGLDDPDKLKSIFGITGIWIEEASELQEADFHQLDIRLRGQTPQYKQILITFNPVSATHWLKKRFFDTIDADALTHHSTYKDNRFLDEAAVRVLEGFKQTDEYYYTVYCLGCWGALGQTVFPAADISGRLAMNIRPIAQGYFTYCDDGQALSSIAWVDDIGGPIKLYAAPQAGRPYVIGGDTAGDGSDSFVGQVLDNISGQQVATLRHRFDEDLYARQMFCLGVHYHNALIGIETNFSTYPVKELDRLGYPNQYVREREDSFTVSAGHAYGFRTTSVTRPVILSGLIRAVREDPTLVCDADTLSEMLTFVRGKSFRPEAEAGAHDDCVMALAIAHHIRSQMRFELQRAPARRAVWKPDQWEDYKNADAPTRLRLIELWGSPF